MSDDWIYLYGLGRATDPHDLDFDAVAAPDGMPFKINVGPVSAIVSVIPADEVMPTRRNMLTHARALEQLMGAGPILPMRFGSIAESDAAIQRTLSNAAPQIEAAIEDLDGFIEVGLTIGWNRVAVMKELVASEPDLKRTYEALAARDPNESHFARVELGRRVEAALGEKRVGEQKRYADRLCRFARRWEARPIDDEVTVLKMDFLIAREIEPELNAAIEALEAENPDRLAIKLVGPSPAYSFVDLRLDWTDGAAETAAA